MGVDRGFKTLGNGERSMECANLWADDSCGLSPHKINFDKSAFFANSPMRAVT